MNDEVGKVYMVCTIIRDVTSVLIQSIYSSKLGQVQIWINRALRIVRRCVLHVTFIPKNSFSWKKTEGILWGYWCDHCLPWWQSCLQSNVDVSSNLLLAQVLLQMDIDNTQNHDFLTEESCFVGTNTKCHAFRLLILRVYHPSMCNCCA